MRLFFGNWGWGRERCPSAKLTQTRFLTFDWRSENEHQEPASRLRCGSRRSLRCARCRCGRDRRAGTDGICSHLRHLRRRLLLHPRHRNLPEGLGLHPLRHRHGHRSALQDVLDKEDFATSTTTFDIDTNDTYDKRARFQLRVDARTETELGTLRTYAAVNFQWDSDATGFDDDASDGTDTATTAASPIPMTTLASSMPIIELGGFRIGKTDSLFSTFTGYAGGVSPTTSSATARSIRTRSPTPSPAATASPPRSLLKKAAVQRVTTVRLRARASATAGDLYTLDAMFRMWSAASAGPAAGVACRWLPAMTPSGKKALSRAVSTSTSATPSRVFVMAAWASVDDELDEDFAGVRRLRRQPELLRSLGRRLGCLGRRHLEVQREGYLQRPGLAMTSSRTSQRSPTLTTRLCRTS